MSGFAVVYERSNTPVDPGVLERVMERLTHRGPDGSDVYLNGHIAMGHWHFWTTPEEVDERQPLALKEMPFRIVFDGRLDNRSELFSSLGIDPKIREKLSDAALTLHAYAHWGEHCFEYFVGEFAVVIFDEQKHRLVCARDQLGDRTLFFSSHQTRLVIASEPWAVAGADGLKPEISKKATAHYFSLRAMPDGQSMFKEVFELLPAHVMFVDELDIRKWRYWQPDPKKKIRYKTDEEYAKRFLSLLEESVRCRMRSTTPIGVQMSGGLDSTSVACLAARMNAPEPLTTISYVFDDLQECDERVYINAIKEQPNIRSVQILCDDVWPFKEWHNWPRSQNYPEGNIYRLLLERVYEHAQEAGLRVLLTGSFGNHLYGAGSDWLADLVVDMRLWTAIKELSFHIRARGFRQTLSEGHLRRIGRRLLDSIFPGSFRFRHKQKTPAWFNPVSEGMLTRHLSDFNPVFERYGHLLTLGPLGGVSREIGNASRHRLEIRNPYRDRRLVEFVLALPAYQLYYHGLNKYILRTAMRGILPEVIRMRSMATSFISLYFRGVSMEKVFLLTMLQNPKASWRKFILADWLLNRWNVVLKPEQDGPEALVLWQCISYDTWYKSVEF